MPSLKCEKCDRPATHKFTRMVEGKALDFFFCTEHAAEFSPPQLKTGSELAQVLAGLVKSHLEQEAAANAAEGGSDLTCATCGMALRKYRQTLLLGCADCYRAFDKQLEEDLRRYHGTVRHSGRQPVAPKADASAPEQAPALQKRLEQAIADEDFELAAKLRDQIRRMKPEG